MFVGAYGKFWLTACWIVKGQNTKPLRTIHIFEITTIKTATWSWKFFWTGRVRRH
ncbi:hypothetical protein MTR67_018750, partial [Solanum verrucosum]